MSWLSRRLHFLVTTQNHTCTNTPLTRHAAYRSCHHTYIHTYIECWPITFILETHSLEGASREPAPPPSREAVGSFSSDKPSSQLIVLDLGSGLKLQNGFGTPATSPHSWALEWVEWSVLQIDRTSRLSAPPQHIVLVYVIGPTCDVIVQ